jgi:hypothetical protein
MMLILNIAYFKGHLKKLEGYHDQNFGKII